MFLSVREVVMSVGGLFRETGQIFVCHVERLDVDYIGAQGTGIRALKDIDEIVERVGKYNVRHFG